MGGTVERIVNRCEGAVPIRLDALLDIISTVVEGCDEVGARDFLVGDGLDEEGDGAAFDGVSRDGGGVVRGWGLSAWG